MGLFHQFITGGGHHLARSFQDHSVRVSIFLCSTQYLLKIIYDIIYIYQQMPRNWDYDLVKGTNSLWCPSSYVYKFIITMKYKYLYHLTQVIGVMFTNFANIWDNTSSLSGEIHPPRRVNTKRNTAGFRTVPTRCDLIHGFFFWVFHVGWKNISGELLKETKRKFELSWW